MSKTQNKNLDKNYEIYLDERKELIHAGQLMYQSFDKAILTLSAGALGISITFINQIAPNPIPDTKCLIISAWIFFSLSVFLTLISFLTSQMACRRQIEICEEFLLNNKSKDDSRVNKPATITTCLNYLSIFFFSLGIMTLVLFCLKNLPFK